MTKSLLAALSLALGVAFSAPLLATTSANAAGTTAQSGTQNMQPAQHKTKKKKHHTSSSAAPSSTTQKKTSG